MKAAGNEARYDAYAKRLLSEKIVLAYILVKVVDEFRGMKPQDVVRYIEGDVRIGDVPLDMGLTNAGTGMQEKEGDVEEESGIQMEEADLLEELELSQADDSRLSEEFALVEAEETDLFGKIELSEIKRIDSVEESDQLKVEVVPSVGTRIVGMNTVCEEVNEGTNIFDIIFYVRTKNGISKIIINVEIQKDEPTKYNILNRVIFYIGRMISSEKQRDFINSNYNDMKEVYSIWLCLGEKENTLNYLQLTDKKVIGSKNWKGNLNLLNAVIIGLSDELPEHNETYDLHRFLGVLLSNSLDYYEKVEIMEKEYELELPEEWEEEMQKMYSFAAEIRKKGERKGRADGRTEGICIMARNMLKNGVPISQIAQMAEVSVEKLQSWLQETDEITKE